MIHRYQSTSIAVRHSPSPTDITEIITTSFEFDEPKVLNVYLRTAVVNDDRGSGKVLPFALIWIWNNLIPDAVTSCCFRDDRRSYRLRYLCLYYWMIDLHPNFTFQIYFSSREWIAGIYARLRSLPYIFDGFRWQLVSLSAQGGTTFIYSRAS